MKKFTFTLALLFAQFAFAKAPDAMAFDQIVQSNQHCQWLDSNAKINMRLNQDNFSLTLNKHQKTLTYMYTNQQVNAYPENSLSLNFAEQNGHFKYSTFRGQCSACTSQDTAIQDDFFFAELDDLASAFNNEDNTRVIQWLGRMNYPQKTFRKTLQVSHQMIHNFKDYSFSSIQAQNNAWNTLMCARALLYSFHPNQTTEDINKH